LKLIDSSSWIHALRRKGDPAVRQRVRQLLDAKEAAWCQVVRLELWRGAENDWDRELLTYLELHVTTLAISESVWQRSIDLSRNLRSKGHQVPLVDLVVFSCAAVHLVEVEHSDKHFDLLTRLFPKGL
jgi:predicted nucleic acid-binding protein